MFNVQSRNQLKSSPDTVTDGCAEVGGTRLALLLGHSGLVEVRAYQLV